MRTHGEIVLVSALLDPQGRNPKDRPCVVISPASEPGEGLPIKVVAITTLIPDPMPDDHVLIPYQRPRHPRTGLNRRAAAVCSWIEWIDEGRVIRPVGFVPARQLLAIAQVLARLDAAGEEAPADEGEGEGPT
jgi:mRNA-degrading endonuclease toxin of MazEF toxin-antitoxin module